MATPKWFDYELYMKNKLTQMQESDPSYTMNDLVAAFNKYGFSEAEGAYKHFQQYGHKEDVSPNSMFNAEYYYQSKALQYYQLEENGGMTVDQIKANMDLYAANMKQAIAKAGMDAWTHYTKYGTAEGVNPSADFNTDAYMQAKYEAWSATEAGSGKTLDEMKAIFKSANINALAHAFQYGTDSTTATAGEAQCWTDTTHSALVEDIASNDDGIEQENPGGDYTLTAANAILTSTASSNVSPAGTLSSGDDTIDALTYLGTATIKDASTSDNDTLNATLTAAATPTIENIENISVKQTGAGAFTMTNVSGAKKIIVHDSTAAFSAAKAGAIEEIEVKDQKADVTFDELTAESLKITTSNFGTDSTTLNTINLGTATAAKATTLTASLTDSYVKLDSTSDDVVKTATVTASGKNFLELTDSKATLTSLTVDGDGIIDFDATDAAQTTLAAIKTITSTNTGGVYVNAGATLESATFGSGDDRLVMAGALGQDAKVDMGAGNDRLVLAAASNASATINGGDGDLDVLAATEKAFLTGKIAGFEVLDIGGSDTQSYDLSVISGLKSVEVSAALKTSGTITNYNTDTSVIFKAEAAGTTMDASGVALTLGTTTNEVAALSVVLNAVDDGGKNTATDVTGVVKGAITESTAKIATLNVVSKVDDPSTGTTSAGDEITESTYVNELTIDKTMTELATVNVGGLASTKLIFNGVDAQTKLTKIDASSSEGDVEVSWAAAVSSISYIGSKGVDKVTTGTKGDTVNGGLGADTVTITTNTVSDVMVYNLSTPAESQIADVDGDGKVTIANDVAKTVTMDKISAFTSGMDKIELDNNSFSSYQKGAILGKTVGASDDLTSVTDFFADTNGDRAVALASVGGNGYVFVDANGDGNFTAKDDMVIQLVAVTSIDLNDISFS